MNLYNLTNITLSTTNYTQQLNSTLVDPSNVPNLQNDTESGPGGLPDSNLNSTMSGDNVDLSKNSSVGMDSSSDISNS